MVLFWSTSLYIPLSFSLTSSKYLSLSASFMLILFNGSNSSNFYKSCSCSLSMFLMTSFKGFLVNLGKVGLKCGSSWHPCHVSLFGVPMIWNILKIWSISLSPLNNAFFSISQANIHPTAQISTPSEYSFWPSNTSGALYHNVSISWVRVLIGMVQTLARPKSAILMTLSYVTRMFWGLRSRCMILLEWQQSTPVMSWYMRDLIYSLFKRVLVVARYFLRSYSEYSNTKSNLLFSMLQSTYFKLTYRKKAILDDIGMGGKFPEYGNLPQRGRGHTLIPTLQLDVLDCNNLLGRFRLGLVDDTIGALSQELCTLVVVEVECGVHFSKFILWAIIKWKEAILKNTAVVYFYVFKFNEIMGVSILGKYNIKKTVGIGYLSDLMLYRWCLVVPILTYHCPPLYCDALHIYLLPAVILNLIQQHSAIQLPTQTFSRYLLYSLNLSTSSSHSCVVVSLWNSINCSTLLVTSLQYFWSFSYSSLIFSLSSLFSYYIIQVSSIY